MLYHRAFLFIAAILPFVTGCGIPALDKEAAATAVAAIEQGPPEAASKIAALGLVQIERGRVSASLLKGLEDIISVSPEHRSQLFAKTVTENLGLLNAACAFDAEALMERLSTESPENRIRIVWDDCKFEKHGLITQDMALQSNLEGLLIAHMIYARVASAGPLDENERTLLVTLTAQPSPTPPQPPIGEP